MIGRFISVEGIEGVGKSTNLRFVADTLRQRGHEVIETREPGGTPLGERIRGLLLDPGQPVEPVAELLLMFAARAAHLQQVIRPALAAGRWVVCDRFVDASRAYQGGGRGIDEGLITELEARIVGPSKPHLTLLLDAPIGISNQRQSTRLTRDRFEREDDDFFGRVRDTYLRIAAREPGRVKVIDASQPIDRVQAAIRQALDAL